MERAAGVAGARSSSSGGVDPGRDLAKVADAINDVEQAIKQVEEKIRRVEEALENDKPYLGMRVPELKEDKILKLLMEEKKLLMEEKKQLREKESKLMDRQQPGLAAGANQRWL